jgi:P27 family predicted phage terminase small subunit
MRGPKPKPASVRALEMPFRKAQRLLSRQTAAIAPVLTAEPPQWFSNEQKEAWTFAIQNAPADVLRNIDRGVLTVYIVAADAHRRASQEASKAELLIPGRGKDDRIPNPIFRIVKAQAELMLRAAGELGFSPSSRSRVHADAPVAAGDWDDVG